MNNYNVLVSFADGFPYPGAGVKYRAGAIDGSQNKQTTAPMITESTPIPTPIGWSDVADELGDKMKDPEILRKLAESTSFTVRFFVATCPYTPVEVLEILHKDDSPHVSWEAWRSLWKLRHG